MQKTAYYNAKDGLSQCERPSFISAYAIDILSITFSRRRAVAVIAVFIAVIDLLQEVI